MSKENDIEKLVSSMDCLNIKPPEGSSSNQASCSSTSSINVSINFSPTDKETDLINGAYVRGFTPLTYSMMIETPIKELETMIRVRLATLIHSMYPQGSERITNILMTAGIWDCYYMLQNSSYFQAAVEHVVAQLSAD